MTHVDEMRHQLSLLTDEELVSIVREHDEDQWRPEAFDIVRSILKERGVSPDENLSEQERIGDEAILDETTGVEMVTLAEYNNALDADTDRMALEERGLRVWLVTEYAAPREGLKSALQLKVRTEDLTTAMAILESEPVPSSDLPPELAEPPCPKCGSRKVTEGAETLEAPAASGSSPPNQAWLYRCASCGYKWTET